MLLLHEQSNLGSQLNCSELSAKVYTTFRTSGSTDEVEINFQVGRDGDHIRGCDVTLKNLNLTDYLTVHAKFKLNRAIGEFRRI